MSDAVILAITSAVSALGGGLITALLVPFAQAKLRRVATPTEEIDAHEKVVKHFESIIGRLESEITRLNCEVEAGRQRYQTLEESMHAECDRCEGALDSMTEQHESLREKYEELQVEVIVLKRSLARQIQPKEL